MKPLFIVFMLLFLTLILGANYYVFYRLWCMLPSQPFRIALIVTAVILVGSLLVSMIARGVLPDALTSALYRIGTTWFFVMVYLLIAFLLLDLIRVTHLLPVDQFMYKSWLGFGVTVGVIAVVMFSGYIRYLHKDRVELNITLKTGKMVEEPIKMVAISDLHLGYGIGNNELEKWVNLINKENADVVLIAGDLIDNSVVPVNDYRMDEVLRKIKSKYGVFMALGNHEYISGVDGSLDFLKKSGIEVLRDSVVLIDNRFYLAGRDDFSNSERRSLDQLTDSLDPSKPLIVIDHQPMKLKAVSQYPVDFQISGHTHHGQIWPISWITSLIYEKSHGYLLENDTHFYVTSGIGLWGGKFRIGSKSEYVVVTINH